MTQVGAECSWEDRDHGHRLAMWMCGGKAGCCIVDSTTPAPPPSACAPAHCNVPLSPCRFPLQGYVDVATLGVLCSNTCGSLHHWCPWSPTLDGDEFFNDLRWSLVRPQVSNRCTP